MAAKRKQIRKYLRADEGIVLARLLFNTMAVDVERGHIFRIRDGVATRLTEYPGGRCGRYRFVMLHHSGSRRKMPVSRVVWMACHGRRIPEGYDIDHENRDRGDNRIENLRLRNSVENRGAWAHDGGAF